jgi:folate-dependent phosphoribosylglycinamide formyltransferase PurN
MDVLERHLKERAVAEAHLLGSAEWPDAPCLQVRTGEINSSTVYTWITSQQPDLIVLYGTGIVKAPLLDTFPGRVINLHLGLSPYYRGAGTNFWPLVYREPECVGSTLHIAAAKVDAGAILAQVRPIARAADRAHDLGTKALIAAVNILPDVIALYARDALVSCEQNLKIGRVFKRHDFNAAAVRQMWENLAAGMMPTFVSSVEERISRFPIWQLKQRT